MNLSLRSPSAGTIVAFKAIVFALCLLPAVNLALGWQANALGANPIETITRASGEWTLRLLLITLAVTPLRRFSGLHWLLRLRRMLGLFAFAYALGHFAIYLWLDQFFDWNAIALDILDRPFITVASPPSCCSFRSPRPRTASRSDASAGAAGSRCTALSMRSRSSPWCTSGGW